MKRKPNWFRLIAFMLSTLMMLTLFAACTNKGEVEDTVEKAGETTEDLYDEGGKLKDKLHGLSFGKEISVLSGAEQKWSLGSTDEMKGNVIGEAIYTRNDTVEERLNLEIKWDSQPNFDANSQGVFMQRLESDIKGSHSYDCVASYNLLPYTLAMKGFCTNLADTKHIDLTGPWWPSAFLEHLMYQDQIYALVTASGKGTLENLSAIFFNNDLIEDHHLESPYTKVANNEWTVGTLREMIKGTYIDLNANGQVDGYDQFGLSTSTNARLTCWYVGMGVRLINRTSAGEMELVAGDSRVGTAIDAIVDLFSTDDSMLVDPNNGSNNNFAMFTEGRGVFYLATLYMGEYCANNNLELNYGVVPNPKMDSSQDRYYTHIPNNHAIWYIPSGVKDVDFSSAFIECMASESYRYLEPIYYENCIKLRFAPDERLAEMFDLVRDSISFDMNYVFRFVFQKDCDTWIRNCISQPTKYSWSSKWEEMRTTINSNFDQIIAYYDSVAAEQ